MTAGGVSHLWLVGLWRVAPGAGECVAQGGHCVGAYAVCEFGLDLGEDGAGVGGELVASGGELDELAASVGWVGSDLQEFGQVNPAIVRQMEINRRYVAIWYMGFGLLSLLVSLQGWRHWSRWAWYALWIVVAVLVAIGVLFLNGFGVYILGLVPIALIGQLLSSRGLFSKNHEAVE